MRNSPEIMSINWKQYITDYFSPSQLYTKMCLKEHNNDLNLNEVCSPKYFF